jgi:hypothetical protein
MLTYSFIVLVDGGGSFTFTALELPNRKLGIPTETTSGSQAPPDRTPHLSLWEATWAVKAV